MKPIQIIRKLTALLLAASCLALTACSAARAEDLTAGARKSAVPIVGRQTDERFCKSSMEFAVELLKNTGRNGENALISPLSVLLALAMTANGAQGETLEEMLSVLGRGMTIGELNEYLRFVLGELPNGKKCSVLPADSVWIRSDFKVEQSFIQTDVDYYDADIFRAPFNDATVNDVNAWVKKHTDGMIDGIIEHFEPDYVMCLVNALMFDAEWSDKYEKYDVQDAVFHAADGSERSVSMMYSDERLIEMESALGFIKPYIERYAFAALLPDEGTTPEAFIASLDGDKLYDILEASYSGGYGLAAAGLPKFKYDFSASLSDALKAMGMETAFDPDSADLSLMGTTAEGYSPYIADVIHKTYIEVAEQGTRAGAAAAVLPAPGCAPEEPKPVVLDRPFVYVIFDCSTFLPIFIGVVNDIA